jgi:ADP-ribose pyrophosphatase
VAKTFTLPGGGKHHFETVWPEGTALVATIALTADNKVIIARQFRPGPERLMDEIPGGTIQPKESPESAARRELLYETGYAAEAMQYLGEAGRDGYTNARWHYFLGKGCVPVPDAQLLEASERIELHLISIEDLIANARENRMTDPTAVLLAYELLMKLRSKS